MQSTKKQFYGSTKRHQLSIFTFDVSSRSGFTLVELLVTLSIIAVFAAMMIVNFSNWRGPQFVKLAANELATNVSKLRSNSLSARSVLGNPAKFYILKLTSGATASQYVVQSVSSSSPQDIFTDPLETIHMPGGTVIQSLTLVDKNNNSTTPACVQIVFALPFGRTYLDGSCSFSATAKSSSQLDAFVNSNLQVIVARSGTTSTKTIIVDGISGRVEIQ